ncbi:hypothetical protein BD289DRAFT_225119 [Coniella lustricola]|uniref:Mid2 domain-containing protein n=1 Tax=Coniella lustricola TaxID=2025994 RepID=A0A2T3AAT0_9PEZI|nr:hypothetical protein BD289DRAFT_225119 [Coniella lustricola]
MRSSSQRRHRPHLSTAGIIPTLVLSLSTLLQSALAGPLLQRDESTWALYTTTWTETETFTSTYSSAWAAATTAASGSGGTCVPPAGSGEIACGSICCASWQYCAYDGQCVSNAGATTTDTAATTSYSVYSTTVTSDGTTITTQYSAPYRVTGTGTASTLTATAEGATGTGFGNGTALATTSGSHLSGGAIAGIVIGSVLGVALLLGICACVFLRGVWHGLLALLGLGGGRDKKRNRSRETIIIEEERYSRHGGTPRTTRTVSHADRDRHTGWFSGNRAARSSAAESRRMSEKNNKESGQTSWWTAGALGTLLVLLGLRRDKKRRQSTAKRTSRPRSTVSSSYYTDYEDVSAGSPSEFSSDYTYSSVYTPVQSQHPRGPRTASVVPSHSVRSASAGGGGGRYRDDYDHPKSNHPPDYAVSESSGGRTRDARRSRRSETTRISRASSRR